jgi:hypothetical protein
MITNENIDLTFSKIIHINVKLEFAETGPVLSWGRGKSPPPGPVSSRLIRGVSCRCRCCGGDRCRAFFCLFSSRRVVPVNVSSLALSSFLSCLVMVLSVGFRERGEETGEWVMMMKI